MKRRAGRECSFRFSILLGLDISTAFIFQKVGQQCCFHPQGEMIIRILEGAPASRDSTFNIKKGIFQPIMMTT